MTGKGNEAENRPVGVTALSIFFWFGAVVSFLSFVSLLFPVSLLEPMWRLNPRAREAFDGMGVWAPILMCAVSAACASAAAGLWRGTRWGYRLALALLGANLLGDVANVLLGTEPRAAVGIPVVAAILAFLMGGRVRRFFGRRAGV
jgi:hypothetical protein